MDCEAYKAGNMPFIDYLPRSHLGSIIFTTRDRKTAVKLVQKNVVDLPAMDEGVATQLLRKCLIDPNLVSNKPDTKALLQELTYFPLAIIQAAAYINENSITLSVYLSLLSEQEEDVIDLLSEDFEDHGRYQSVKNPVATTWLISFEQINCTWANLPPTGPPGWNFGNSTDGTCGGANGMTCGSLFGECCNKNNVCGSLPSDCGVGW